MAEQDEDYEVAGTVAEQMLEQARRQTKALQTIVVVLELTLFLGVLAAVLWLIAVLGS